MPWLSHQNEIEQFLYREARYLDDREFEKWLACYAARRRVLDSLRGMTRIRLADRSREMRFRSFTTPTGAGWRIGSSGSGPTAPARPAFPNPGPATTSRNVETVEPGRRHDRRAVQLAHHVPPISKRRPYFGTTYCTIDVSGRASADPGAKTSS